MNKKYLSIVRHYEDCFKEYGDSHLGVDWPNSEDVYKRYDVMMDLFLLKEDRNNNIDLLDFGCGLSHLYEYIQKKGYTNIKYCGIDISKKFYETSKKKFPHNDYYCIDILEDNFSIREFDYIVMNGVFTEKRNLQFNEMFQYFKKVIIETMKICNKGIAFNVMSKDVDWERDDLFHLPLNLLSDFLTKNISRNFIIRNDYGLYEYTTYVYK